MYQYHVRLFFFQYFLDTIQDIGGHIEQRLLVFHDRQIIVRCNIKGFKNHIQHLAVLSGYTNNRLKLFAFLQFLNKRAHFYCFRPGAENEHYFFHIS